MSKRKIKVEDKQYRVLAVEIKTIDTEKASLEAVFSTGKEDRHGDVVLQDGWDLKNFKKNPVILNSHNYGDASEVIGRAEKVKVVDGKLEGKIIFAVNENPKAKVIFDLYAGGFLNAFSVGFMIKKFASDDKGVTDYYTISEAELLEVSAVSVPANAQALAKQKGIDIEILGKVVEPEEDEDEEEDNDEPTDDDIETDDDIPEEDDYDDKGCGGKRKPKKKVDHCEECEKRRQEELAKEKENEIDTEVKLEKKESYGQKVIKAIKSIDEKERQSLERAAKIIKSILDGDIEGNKLEEKTQVQIKKRKVNQAIRELLKSK